MYEKEDRQSCRYYNSHTYPADSPGKAFYLTEVVVEETAS